ncbi:MAG: rhodanese-like domain-containing protein [Flavobacteriales bacterium]
MQSIHPAELAEWRSSNKEHQLIDVREDYEVQTCSISGHHIPMAEITERLSEIRKDVPVVIHCKSGRRSEAVAEYLLRHGYSDIYSLSGGILGWIDSIDSSLERY